MWHIQSREIFAGYNQSMNDHSLFINSSKISFTTILVYVDDIILVGNDKEEIDRIKQALNKTFKIIDLGDLRLFLGLEVARSKKGIRINQRKYALELLKDACLLAYKPENTPMDNLVKLSSTGSVPFTNVHAYRRMIGRLMYLTNTWLDITFYVPQLSQFLDKPTIAHYNATIRILRYIKGAPSLGLFLSSSIYVHLKAFCDSDWGTHSGSRQSVSGFSVYLGNSLISWKSKNNIKEFLWSWIQDNDHYYMWYSMASLFSSRFQNSFWATISFILWQWLSKIHCNKPSVLWA